MNIFVHKSEDRGHVKMDWLDTKHSFSFGHWHDPRYMGVSVLRVINDDQIAAQRGFGRHGHNNMEILTYVLSGAITHQDSMGNHGEIHAGEWQLMSAGTGIEHSEQNQGLESVRLLQIWLYPNQQNVIPRYQQQALDPYSKPNQWHVIVAPDAEATADQLKIHQDVRVLVAAIHTGQTLQIQPQKSISYVHVIAGYIRLNDQLLNAGDAIAFEGSAELLADHDAHVLWFDLPAHA